MKSPWWIGLGLMSLVAFCTVAVAADEDCEKKDKDAVSLVADEDCEMDKDLLADKCKKGDKEELLADEDCEKKDKDLLADEDCEKKDKDLLADEDCEKEKDLLADKCKKGDKEELVA